jgi:hypothetical protein
MALAAISCLTLGLPAAAQASTSPPSGVVTEPAEATASGFNLKGKLNPGGLPTTYYFEYARDTCDEGCTPSKTAKGGPLTGDTQQEVRPMEVSGLSKEKATYWFRLVASNVDGTVDGGILNFTTPAPLPSIASESVSHVISSDAMLEAQINPQGDQAGDYYQFQLVKDPSEYAPEILCPTQPPPTTDGCIGTHSQSALPIGWVCGSCERENAAQQVQLDLASAGVTLKPATTYHYRVIAARAVQTEDTIQWEPPPVYGPDQTFTTPPAGSAPVIDSVSVSHLSSSDATLEAQLNTEGLETSYQFRLESGCLPPQACPEITVYPLPSGKLLGSFVDQSVSLELNSAGVTLAPGTEYAYAVTATNADGSATGHEQRFTTPQNGVQPLPTTPSPGPQPGTGAAQNTGQPAVTSETSGPADEVPSPKTRVPTNAQKLAKVLKLCAKKPKKQRASCKKYAHRTYRATASKVNER